jgi:putative peptidoglycan lipid II flippase
LTTPPPGPGWNGHQQPDAAWNTDPLYDDTGWHLDLSELHGVEASPRLDPLPEPASTEHSAFPFQPSYDGNGVAAGNSGSDWLTASPAGPQDRPAGRHARHARPAEDGAASPPRDYQPQGYQPAEYEYPESSSPLARYSYPDRTAYPERPATEPRGHPRYPESASPLARYSYPDPPAYQPYAEPEAPAPPPDRYRQYDQYQQYDQHDQHEQYERPVAQARPMNPTLALESMMPAPLAVEAIPAAPLPAETTGTQSASILRSSGVMAVGTLGSRLTGFLRTIAQSYALGALGIAEAYNLSNTLPNVVYNLALGGILTSVIVPLIVNSKKRDADRGEAYEQRMFTLVTALLLGVTVLATLAAVPIVHLYSGSAITGKTEHIAIIFAFFFIPQIFFYGVSSLIGAVLNTRGSFAAPMWTPIINNFVVIGVLGLYVAMAGLDKNPATITGTEVDLLGVGTTLGIIAQTAALVPALRKVGFRWQPRTDFHRAEVREIGRMAGWMLCYIGATQVAFLITTKIAGDVASGITYYNYAWLLFQLPYAVVGISVITALLPRMSAHASEGRLGLVRTDFSAGIRLASAIVVPCSLVLAVLGPPIAELFLAHGATTPAQGRDMGVVFAVFCLGLLPYMVFQLQLRVFYSLHDSKTPALIGLVTMSVNIAANVIAAHSLRNTELVAGLGVGFGLANLLGTAIAWRILSRRVGGLDGRAIGGAVARMYAATVPAAMLALLVSLLVDHVVTGARGAALLAIVLGGGGALLVYVLFARSLRITELTSLSRTVLSRLGR